MFKRMLIVFFILSTLLFYSLIGIYIFPPLVKNQLIQSIEKVINQKASIDSVSFNPFTFKIAIFGLRLFDEKTQEPLAGAEAIEADFDPSYMLLKEMKIASASIQKPFLHIRINDKGELNLSALLGVNHKDTNEEIERTELQNIVLDTFSMTEGKIDITDSSGGKKVFQSLTLSRAGLNNFTTIKKSKNELQLYVQGDDGSRLEYAGRIVSVEPLDIEGDIELHGAKVHTYWKYVQNSLGFVVSQGEIDASISHAITFKEAKTQIDIKKYKIALKNLLLEENETTERLLEIPKLVLEGSADITNARYSVRSAEADALFVKLRQNSEGETNWLSYFPKQNAQKSESSAIAWDIKSLKIKNSSVEFEDRFYAKNAKTVLNEIQLNIEELSSKKQSTAKSTLSFRVNKTGKVEAKSRIRHTPLKIETELKLSGVELSDFQSYLDRYADVKINSATADLDLKALITDENRSFSANAQINGLSLSRPHEKSVFLSLSELLAKKIEFSSDSKRVRIERVDLVSPYFRIEINADKKTNLFGIVHENTKTPAELNTSDEVPTAFLIDKIALEKGEVMFADRSLEVPFQSNIHAIKGSIMPLGTQADVKSTLNLEGTIDKYALAKISGTFLLSQPKTFSKIDLELKNINMNKLSPYARRIIGYTLKKGKLDADLSYKVNNAQMNGRNKIVLKELELGEKVKSSAEASSSIELALSLLKDSRGEIDLDVPVSGNLDAPDFSIPPLILKVFRNLTVGIATAPFRFIGKIVGIDAQKLENVYFEAGRAEILPPEREILEKLSGVLIQKKGLILTISGAYNEALDGIKMKKKKVYTEVLSRAKEETMDIAQMPRDELDAVLKKLYLEYFDKENYEGEKERVEAKKLDEHTEKEMLREQITEALAKAQDLEQRELEELAQERGENIMEYLRSRGVEEERLQLLKISKTERSAPQNGYIPSRLALGVKKSE